MVPITKDDCVLVIVLVRLVLGVDDEGGTETVHVLVTVVRVPPAKRECVKISSGKATSD